MNAADRIALVDRLARARAWNRLEEHERAALRRTAEADIAEIEVSKQQLERIGWLFVELDPEEVEP